MPSYYNIFVGTENGIFKGINSLTRAFNNLNDINGLTKDKEIVSMCWANNDKQDKIFFMTRDNHLVKYDCDLEAQAPFDDLGCLDVGNGLVKGIECFAENNLVTCTQNGTMKHWLLETEQKTLKLIKEFSVGPDVACIKKSPFHHKEQCIIATGGKESDLKVWNLTAATSDTAIFKAKNVPDNWMRLREPIWVMCIDYLDENRVVVGTAYNQIRVYDFKNGLVRKPLVNLTYGKFPITSMTVVTKNLLIVGNTHGEMEMIDLNPTTTTTTTSNSNNTDEAQCIRKFKTFQGTIKSMQLKSPLVATCGLDRFLRVHNVDTAQLMLKIYLKSRLNCLLYSKNEPVKATSTAHKAQREDDELSNINSEDLGTDDLWSDMEQVIDENPILLTKSKRKSINNNNLDERLEEFASEASDIDANNNKNNGFKKPKSLKLVKKSKNVK